MEADPGELNILAVIGTILSTDPGNLISTAGVVTGILLIAFLLLCSGLISASENAFFSLDQNDIHELTNDGKASSKFVLKLLQEPEPHLASRRLLAVILILNNLINVGIIILSTYLISHLWVRMPQRDLTKFLFEVVIITFALVLFGEIIPKIYATQNNIKIARLMARPLRYAGILIKPFVVILVSSSKFFDRYIERKQHAISLEELNQAIEIASDENNQEEKNILKGIVNFGNIDVKQIMKARMDVHALDIRTSGPDLLDKVKEWGYSRIPIYEENFDNIIGILYIKDLLPLVNRKRGLKWQSIIRAPFFVPEYKKIDALLEEFQEKRIHMAIVVDEYGGSMGIVTMEDILEEIFGDIKDEFDEDERIYSRLDDKTYIFEGKTLLMDIARTLDLNADFFADSKGEADTIGGFLMEIHQDIPPRGEVMNFKNLKMTVDAADKRRVLRVKIEIEKNKEEVENEKHA